ncbi:site-2 protease family protein [Thermicanus aegyptius]|uniref:site-2 protease family protein n=1 Tax=Thermicanus aegyptius TaxID=94009 RepID=UPI00041299B7|nr:site-2 protease family protein [Thermicanus aegyptius]
MGISGEGEKTGRIFKSWGKWGGVLAFLSFLGSKLKLLLPFLKLGQAGGTLWSMLLMIWAYTLIYPLEFSIGVVLMIFLHEMGHVWAAHMKKVPVSAPAFIPFLGALITLKKQPQNAATEAFIALGGPLLGSIGAFIVLLLALGINHPPFYLIALVGFSINLINLLPIHPLDGGRIVVAISRWLWLLGLIGGLGVILYLRSFLFLFIWILFAWQLFHSYIGKNKSNERRAVEYLKINRQVFEERILLMPGTEHERVLDFSHYSSLEDRSEKVEIFYPGAGSLGEISFPHGEIVEVKMKGIKQANEEALYIPLMIRYIPNEDSYFLKKPEYYKVPALQRLFYGISYFGLAGALGWLIYLTYQWSPPISFLD